MKKFINKYIFVLSFSRLLKDSWVLSKNYRWQKKYLIRLGIGYRFSIKDKYKTIRISIPYIIKRTNYTEDEIKELTKYQNFF
jgi:hypothetical protein